MAVINRMRSSLLQLVKSRITQLVELRHHLFLVADGLMLIHINQMSLKA